MPPQPKPHTFRSERYLAYIRTKHCLICGSPNTVPHHEGLGCNMIGGKPPDLFTVSLCVPCHRLRHDIGPMFWDRFDIKMEILKLLTEYIEQLEQ